jgi:hypothetical protein
MYDGGSIHCLGVLVHCLCLCLDSFKTIYCRLLVVVTDAVDDAMLIVICRSLAVDYNNSMSFDRSIDQSIDRCGML